MNISNIDNADLLAKSALELNNQYGILDFLGRKAKVLVSGSLALDLMVYPDIDLYLELDADTGIEKYLGECAAHFIQKPDCLRVKVEKQMHDYRPNVPNGTFLSLKFKNNIWKLPWKFDIWVVDKEFQDKHFAKMKSYKDSITKQKRKLILDFKNKLVTSKGRTAQMTSHHVYDAVLFHNIDTFDKLSEYLESKGFMVPTDAGKHTVFK